jgi:hypothetical protein
MPIPVIVNDTEDVNVGLADLVFSEPASLAAGDLLLACLANFASGGGAIAIPGNITGFTSSLTTLADDGTGTIRTRLTRRVADGTEGPTYTSVIADGNGSSGKLLRITGASTTSPIDNTGNAEGTGTTATFPVVAVAGAVACLAVALVNGNGAVAASGATGWTLYDGYDSDSAAIYYRTVVPGASTPAATIGGFTSDTWSVDVVLIAAAAPDPVTISPAGSGNSTASTATLAFDCGDSFAVGDFIVVCISADNNGTAGVSSLSSVTDAGGNTYTLLQATYDPGAAAAGQTVGIAYARTTTPLVATDDVTVNFSPNTTSKAAVVFKLHPDFGITLQFVTSGFGAGSATGTPTITTSTINTGDVVVAALAVESNEAVTADADSTNGSWSTQATATGNTGTVATSSRIASQNKIVTATATQTYNPTMTSRDCINGWVTFTPAFIRPNIQVQPSQAVHRSRNW